MLQPQVALAWIGPAYLLLMTLPLAFIDIRQRRLPNKIVLPGLAITLVGQVLSVLAGAQWQQLAVAWATAVTVFALAAFANYFGALGMGDVKLMALMTAALSWFGWQHPLIAFAVAFLLATMGVLVLFVSRRAKLGSTVALGPYLLAGFAVAATGLAWS
jgi:leader peptidase (prepilin peptidase)/N-methyltransferase